MARAEVGGGQSYVERPPVPALAGVVSAVWIQRVAPGAPPYVQRNIPHGGIELQCPVGSEPRVVGPLTAPIVDVLALGTTVVGARLSPGAAAGVLGLPALALVDHAVGIGDVLGNSGRELGERVNAARTPEDALGHLQRYLAGRLAQAAEPDRIVSETVRRFRWGAGDVGALTSTLYVSERQLRRRVRAATGLAPKVLHRVLRFQRFLALAQHAMARGKPPAEDGLALLAAEAGYADQPHLNRECVRLTGMSPGVFLGAAEETCACGHDHAASFTPLLRSRR